MAEHLTRPDESLVNPLSDVVMTAARGSHGKQEAAARHLGKDPGNFSRDVKAGRMTLQDLAKLGPTFLADLGHELTERYGALATPKDRARRSIQNIERELIELKQFVDFA